MAIRTSTLHGAIRVIDLHGNLVGGEETIAFRSVITELLEQQCQKLILDFSDVAYVNSTALGVLIAAHASSARRGCRIVLCNLSKSVHSLLVITKLNLILDVRGTCDEAIAALT